MSSASLEEFTSVKSSTVGASAQSSGRSQIVEETIAFLHAYFPWMFEAPASSLNVETSTPHFDLNETVHVNHFIGYHGDPLPATAENYAADVDPYIAEVRELMQKASQSTNPCDRHTYTLQAGMYASRAARNAFRALDLGFEFVIPNSTGQ